MTDANIKRLPSIYQQQFRRYVDAGYQPRPVDPGTKECHAPGWTKDTATVAVPRGADFGIGLLLGTRLPDGSRLVAVDADRDDFIRLGRALVPTPCERIGAKGIALFARVAEQNDVRKFDLKLADGSKAGDFLGAKTLCVIPPTIHPTTNQPYRWTKEPLLEAGWERLPVIDPEFIKAAFASEHLATIMSGSGTHDAVLKYIGQLTQVSDDTGYIEAVVTACLPEDYDGNSLTELPGIIRDTIKKLETGRWMKVSADVGDAPAFSEEHLALEFVARYGDDFRYVAKGMGWMTWDGQRWQPDDKLSAFNHARAICREFARRAGKQIRRSVASAKTRAAVVSLAQNDERIAATADQWDSDPWLLNTPGGTVELKTGLLRPHARGDHITKMTAVAPDPACPTPLWTAFLKRVTAGDADYEAYLQRVSGYCLTGLTIEHALFFGWGTGANGKSTFINAIMGIANDYARPVPMEALMWSRNERHPTELAGLRGARIATAIETGKGRNWDEPKIMALTGGDKISARLMRQDFSDFIPQFKLIIAGNHKPGLRSVNEAIRRRLHLLPFTVTIPKDERDPQLGDKLKAEWPGILAWMIDGCLRWQRHGLMPPTVVTEATDDYLEAQDTLAQFLDEYYEVDPRAEVKSSTLFEDWKIFAERVGERLRHQKEFNGDMESKGFKYFQDKRGSWFRGLRRKDPKDEAAAEGGGWPGF